MKTHLHHLNAITALVVGITIGALSPTRVPVSWTFFFLVRMGAVLVGLAYSVTGLIAQRRYFDRLGMLEAAKRARAELDL